MGKKFIIKPTYVGDDSTVLETDVDRLFDLIKDKRNIKISVASRKLNATKEEIIEWAEILEENRMIKIHYPLIGEPVLSYIKPEEHKSFKEREVKKPTHPRPKMNKKVLGVIFVSLIGVFFTYVYLVNNLFTYNIRAQINFAIQNINTNLAFLNLPLTPIYLILAILIAVPVLVLGIRKITKKMKARKEKKHEKILSRKKK